MELVGGEIEDVFDVGYREVARRDAVFAGENTVEDEVGATSRVIVVETEPAKIGGVSAPGGGPGGRWRDAVEAASGDRECVKASGEFDGADAEFEDAFSDTEERWQRAGELAVVAQKPVDQAEHAAALAASE